MLLFKIEVMLCQLSVHTKVISTCIYSFPNSFLLDYYITLSIAPCAIQSSPVVYLFYYIIVCICYVGYMTLDKLLKLWNLVLLIYKIFSVYWDGDMV